MSFPPIFGRPGPQGISKFTHKYVMRAGAVGFFPGGGLIDTAKTRDVQNTLAPLLLTPGLLMGKVTATGYWANSILGVTTGAYTSGGTEVTVSAAQAVEIVRRVGATGSLIYVAPPTAGGTVASITKAYSAINTTTGVITTADIAANMVAGALVIATDGSGVPRSFIPDGYGLTMGTDTSNLPALAEWWNIPVEGMIESGQLCYWPTDASLKNWVRESLVRSGYGGKFTFSDLF